MNKDLILFWDRFDEESLLYLKSCGHFRVKKNPDSFSPEDLAEAVAIVIRSGTRVNSQFLEAMPCLRLVISTTSGFDHLDLEELQRRQIVSYYCPHANVASASELCFQLLLTHQKNFILGQKMLASGNWQREKILGTELEGKTLGIIGLGRIGSRVAKLARAFAMECIAFDPYLDPEEHQNVAELLGLEEVLRRSDFISLHVPLTRDTERMFRRNQFESMQEHAILINCSRGNVVSESELITALDEGKLAGAILDVFAKEPLDPESEVARHPKILCSPHLGGATIESQKKAAQRCIQILEDYLLKGLIPDEGKLPPTEPWYNEAFRTSRAEA